MAFTEVVRIVALNWDSVTGGALGIVGIPRLTRTWQIALVLMVVAWGTFALRRSHLGRVIAAIRADEVPCAAMGVDIFRHRLGLFVASGAVSGLAGGLAGHMNFFIGPNDFGLLRTVDALAYPILGGLTTVAGPVLGALVFTVLPEVLRFSSQLREVLVGLLLLGAVLFLPGGLAGLRLPRLLFPRRVAVPGWAPLGERSRLDAEKVQP
jgi:branched-chain amino acid transport system permease protein